MPHSALTYKCCCGNILRTGTSPDTVVVERPCACDDPGNAPVPMPEFGLPSWVTKKQHRERTRLGLPPVTEIERHAMRSKR